MGATIPHEIIAEHGGARVLLRPASRGTGVIAGGGVRAVVEAAGVKDLLSKSLGSANALNVILATLKGLRQLKNPEDIAQMRGVPVSEVQPPWSQSYE
jgi:small subunit ribosomal protein S5